MVLFLELGKNYIKNSLFTIKLRNYLFLFCRGWITLNHPVPKLARIFRQFVATLVLPVENTVNTKVIGKKKLLNEIKDQNKD